MPKQEDIKKTTGPEKKGKIKIARTKAFIKESLEKQSGSAHGYTEPDIALGGCGKKNRGRSTGTTSPCCRAFVSQKHRRFHPLGGLPDSMIPENKFMPIGCFAKWSNGRKTELIDMPFPQPYWAYKHIEGRNNKKTSVFNRIRSSKNFETQLKRQSGEQFLVLGFCQHSPPTAQGPSIGRFDIHR